MASDEDDVDDAAKSDEDKSKEEKDGGDDDADEGGDVKSSKAAEPAGDGERPFTPEEQVEIKLAAGDSDDEFELIAIKEKVKDFQKQNPDTRIPPNLINEAVRWRLNRNDCQNRGYVLDGYPKNAQSAKDVFVITPEKPAKKAPAEGEDSQAEPEEDEEVDAEALKPVLQKNIYPESVISLNATELFLKRRSNHLQAQAISDAMKWHASKLGDKLKNYNAENAVDLFKVHPEPGCECIYPTQKFFQDNKTEIFELDAEGDKYEMFESMRIYIERFGRPYNYLKSVKELNEEREKHLIEEERETKAAAEHGSKKDVAKLEAQKAALEKMFEQRLKHVDIHMKELTECDDLNMRQFLMKYIIPVLTEGMIDVWKMGPLDPVDYLADYIFKRSNGT